jgi:hypothetical protein
MNQDFEFIVITLYGTDMNFEVSIYKYNYILKINSITSFKFRDFRLICLNFYEA